MAHDRESTSLGSAIGLAVGIATLLAMIGGAGVVWGQHDQADKHREESIQRMEQRLQELEHAFIYEHGGEQLPHAARKD